jgi:hypothetical protein
VSEQTFETAALARIRKSEKTEIRVQVLEWEVRRTLDIRTWTMPRDADEHRPTPRGARIPLDGVPERIAALQTVCTS